MSMKYRQIGQAHPDEVSTKNHRREIEEREQSSKDQKDRRSRGESASVSSGASKRLKLDAPETPAGNVDADDALDDLDDDVSADEDSDDEAELMAELERIRKERAAEKAAKDAREHAEQERIRQENILHGNPLLSEGPTEFRVKRRWDDDVVFKNCARGLDERKKEPSFINDAIRSEFHKKFMSKYIQ
jgi:protein CWC15